LYSGFQFIIGILDVGQTLIGVRIPRGVDGG